MNKITWEEETNFYFVTISVEETKEGYKITEEYIAKDDENFYESFYENTLVKYDPDDLGDISMITSWQVDRHNNNLKEVSMTINQLKHVADVLYKYEIKLNKKLNPNSEYIEEEV